MKSILLYDSQYGNTAKIATAIADTLKQKGEVALLKVSQAGPGWYSGASLLVVGSPTQQFRPTQAMRDCLDALPAGSLHGIKVAAFDTRLTEAQIRQTAILAFFVRIAGYAAGRIAAKLTKAGGELVAQPAGFFVQGMEGPLVEGELERAVTWAQKLFA